MADGASTGHLVDNHASRAKWSFPWAGRTRDERSQAWLDTLERLDKLQGDRIPEYDAAIRSSSVTLQQIVEGRHRLCEDSRTNEKSSPISSEYEELLLLAYQHARGEIVRYYFSSDQRAAVVLVKPHKDKSHKNKAMDLDLDLFYPIEELAHLTPQFEATLWTCISQFHRIAEVDLDIKGRYEVFHELYLIVVYLFVVLESQQAYHQNQYRHVLSRAKQILGFVLGRTRRGPGQERSDAATVHTPDISPTPLRVNAKVIEDFIGERIKITERIKEALDQANNHLRELEETIGQFATREARGYI
jgi:hypothetical protein